MSGIIDVHCHILPGIDDGSRSVEESLTMLRSEAAQGIRHVVATPHFYAHQDTPEHFLAKRAAAEETLRAAMKEDSSLPGLEVGAEVHYYSGIGNSEILSELTMGHGGCILIEMPQPPWTSRMYYELEEIRSRQNLTPIIAHIDRYIGPFRTHGIPENLEKLPVLVQANAGFFLRRGTTKMALRMLERGQIHLLGSDCHDMLVRAPNLQKAEDVIRSHLGREPLDRIQQKQQMMFAK